MLATIAIIILVMILAIMFVDTAAPNLPGNSPAMLKLLIIGVAIVLVILAAFGRV